MTQKYITLPGDVLVTIKVNSQSAGATTFSLPNIHGDVFATVNADGALLSTFMTGPFGEVLPNQPAQLNEAITPTSSPTNTADGTTYQYVGQHEKLTDLDTSPISGGVVQMGARVYIPKLGRFLQADPVEGGTANNYAYSLDSINESDLDGKASGPLSYMSAPGVSYTSSCMKLGNAGCLQRNTNNLINISMLIPVGGGALAAARGAEWAATRVAGAAWKGGVPAMLSHYAKHGAALGYKGPVRYTLGAIKQIIVAQSKNLLSNGAKAYIQNNRAVLTYGKKITTFFKSKSISSWLKNQRR